MLAKTVTLPYQVPTASSQQHRILLERSRIGMLIQYDNVIGLVNKSIVAVRKSLETTTRKINKTMQCQLCTQFL